MRPIFAARRDEPRDDLISALVAVEDEGQRLTETELLSLTMLILGAGHETTTNLIANAVLALLRHPDERRRLQDDPSLIGSAVEEFLRYDSPVQLTDRVATVDCEIDGRPIRRGARRGLLIGAANRDPAQFPDPDRLDIGRHGQPAPVVRPRRALLSRRGAGARRSPDRHRDAAATLSGLRRRACPEAVEAIHGPARPDDAASAVVTDVSSLSRNRRRSATTRRIADLTQPTAVGRSRRDWQIRTVCMSCVNSR